MAGYTYNGKPLPCDEYAKWRKSVHGKALLDKGDLSAPTCNNCHGNHGAAPPQIGLRRQRLRHLPRQDRQTVRGHQDAAQVRERRACPAAPPATAIMRFVEPTDDFLGMQQGAFCVRCHEQGKEKHGATIAGAKAAETIHADLAAPQRRDPEGRRNARQGRREGDGGQRAEVQSPQGLRCAHQRPDPDP